MPDFELQRKNMVESQVRPAIVTDRRIIRAMQSVPRERYVPEASPLHGLCRPRHPDQRGACAHRAPPGGPHDPEPGTCENDLVLELAAGTGYTTALLARIAMTVVALESDAAFQRRLAKH